MVKIGVPRCTSDTLIIVLRQISEILFEEKMCMRWISEQLICRRWIWELWFQKQIYVGGGYRMNYLQKKIFFTRSASYLLFLRVHLRSTSWTFILSIIFQRSISEQLVIITRWILEQFVKKWFIWYPTGTY